MLSSRFVTCIFCAAALALVAGFVSGQTYPSKPIRIVAPLPGGSGDLPARLIAQGISAPLGQPVIVDNRAAIVAIDIVLKAPPDGHTMILYSDPLWYSLGSLQGLWPGAHRSGFGRSAAYVRERGFRHDPGQFGQTKGIGGGQCAAARSDPRVAHDSRIGAAWL